MTPASRISSAARQHGSTLTGFIVGLIVGLVCAVVVALIINKGATPFTDKAGKAGKTPEPTAGQISDPNKPMYGSKDAAREANKEFSKDAKAAPTDANGKIIAAAPGSPAAATPGAPTPVAVAASAAGAPAAVPGTAPNGAKPAAPIDPTKAPAKPAAPAIVPGAPVAADAAKAAPAAAPDDKFVYYLQTGAFRDVADAESARAKLALLGFEASVSDRTSDGGVLHRVRLGPYNQIEAMNKIRAKLSENGVDVAVVRNQK